MNNALDVLQALLPELAVYAQTGADVSLPDFAAWLHRRTGAAEAAALPRHREPAFLNSLSPLMQLGPLLNRLTHFSHQYVQQALAGLPVTAIREFIVLAAVASGRTPTKSEIALASLLELSTITEITRRLSQAGLVAEVPDPTDRRARRLQVTPTGQQVYTEAKARLAQVSTRIYEPLTPAEQAEFRRLLSRLNDVHSAHPLPPLGVGS